MPSIAFAVPVLAGKTEDGRRFAAEAHGPRLEEYRESERRLGVSKENWHLQHTPAGDLIIVYFEAADVPAVFQRFAASQEPFDVWFKQQVQGFTGADFNQPPPGMPSECLGEIDV